MKKTYTLFLSIITIVSVLLCGCRFGNNGDSEPKELETIVYSTTEGGVILRDEKAYEKFKALEYKENVSKDTITIDILGTKYTGIYTNTVKLPRLDMEVYDYKLQETEDGRVLINTKTNTIVEYVCIPHSESLTNENDYIAFIKKMLGENHDLSKYDYKCKTHYYSRRPKEIRSQFVDGFRILEENDRLGSYCFFYTKYKNGIKMPEYIYADIDEDTFYLEVYEYDYESTTFSPILDRMDEVEENVEKHLRDNLKDGCTLVSIEHGSKNVFIQDGVPYVMISSTVTYITERGREYSTVVQTITG